MVAADAEGGGKVVERLAITALAPRGSLGAPALGRPTGEARFGNSRFTQALKYVARPLDVDDSNCRPCSTAPDGGSKGSEERRPSAASQGPNRDSQQSRRRLEDARLFSPAIAAAGRRLAKRVTNNIAGGSAADGIAGALVSRVDIWKERARVMGFIRREVDNGPPREDVARSMANHARVTPAPGSHGSRRLRVERGDNVDRRVNGRSPHGVVARIDRVD